MPSLEEATAQLTAPGQPFEIGEEVIRGIPTRVWKRAPRNLPAVLETSRGYGDERVFLVYEDETFTFEQHFRAAATSPTGSSTSSASQGRPGRHRHAQLPRVADRVLGRRRRRRRRRSAERVVDRRRARVRTGRLGQPRSCSSTASGASGSPTTSPTCGLDDVVVARAETDLAAAGIVDFEDVARRRPPDADLAAAVDTRARGRRHDLLHVGHDRAARRARSARTATSARNLMSLALRARRATAMRSRRRAAATPDAGAARRTPTCCRCRSSTPPAATRCSSPTWRPAAKLVLMHKWDAGAGPRADRARADHHASAACRRWCGRCSSRPTSTSATPPAVRASATAARRRRPSWCAASRSCSAWRHPSNGYGLTETSSVTTMNARRRLHRASPTASGVPVPVVDVKVVDADGNDVAARRGRRAVDQGPERREGLLEQARGDRGGVQRRLAALRRHRPHRRRGLRLHRRPGQGHGHPRRRERLLRRGRGGAVRASGGDRRRGDRHPAPRARRGGRRGRPAATRAVGDCRGAARRSSANASPRSRCRCGSGSATSRCPATLPARSSSASCARNCSASELSGALGHGGQATVPDRRGTSRSRTRRHPDSARHGRPPRRRPGDACHRSDR